MHIILLALAFASCISFALANDGQALCAFYDSISDQGRSNLNGWCQKAGNGYSPDVCSWTGVFCDGNSRVISLGLSPIYLGGSISSSIGDLIHLTYLSLSTTNLTSSIPSELGRLTDLQVLYLAGNNLTGSIPNAIGGLKALTNMSLYQNELSSTIPPSIGQLVNVKELFFGENKLTGAVPPTIGNLGVVTILDLSSNSLSSAIPSQLGQLTKLYTLLLNKNSLTGSVPASLCSLPSNVEIDIRQNPLLSCAPSCLATIQDALLDPYLQSSVCSAPSPTPAPSPEPGMPVLLPPFKKGQELFLTTQSYPNVGDCSGPVVTTTIATGICEQTINNTFASGSKIVSVTVSLSTGFVQYTTQLFSDSVCSSPNGAPTTSTLNEKIGACMTGGQFSSYRLQALSPSMPPLDPNEVLIVGFQTMADCTSAPSTWTGSLASSGVTSTVSYSTRGCYKAPAGESYSSYQYSCSQTLGSINQTFFSDSSCTTVSSSFQPWNITIICSASPLHQIASGVEIFQAPYCLWVINTETTTELPLSTMDIIKIVGGVIAGLGLLAAIVRYACRSSVGVPPLASQEQNQQHEQRESQVQMHARSSRSSLAQPVDLIPSPRL